MDSLTRDDQVLIRQAYAKKVLEMKKSLYICSKSPIGVCVYLPDDDPCYDDCVFCHQPHERK